MSKLSMGRAAVASLVALSLTTGLGACTGPGPAAAYTGPGWYLERSYIIVAAGPKVFGGPFSYDKCEEERLKLSPDISPEMLCVNHPGPPRKYGMY